MKKIVVFGCGYVGLVMSLVISKCRNYKIFCVDVDKEKINNLKNGHSTIYDKNLDVLLQEKYRKINFLSDYNFIIDDVDIVFIAVGTPEKQDGSADLHFLWDACEKIKKTIRGKYIVVIKSTVPTGTSDKIQKYFGNDIPVVFSPEFLSQGNAVYDFEFPKRIIIGCDNNFEFKILKSLYSNVSFVENIPIIKTTRRNAEMIKYASNCFLALKVSYINELANLCTKLNADISIVAEGMGYDDRIGPKFLEAGIGYGGSCFPKDTTALLNIAKNVDVELSIVEACVNVNNKQKFYLLNRLLELQNIEKKSKVAILGVTFKPNTDDIRNSPAIDNIKELIKLNCDVFIYDPRGLDRLKCIFGNKITYCHTIDETISDAEAVFIFTDWDEIKSYPYRKFSLLMKSPIVLDGRNCYEPAKIRNHGINYICIGR